VNLAGSHHIPIGRAAIVLCQLAGITVSTGWMAGIGGQTAALVRASGFMQRVREPLRGRASRAADELRLDISARRPLAETSSSTSRARQALSVAASSSHYRCRPHRLARDLHRPGRNRAADVRPPVRW
jgi:hypothetical protein